MSMCKSAEIYVLVVYWLYKLYQTETGHKHRYVRLFYIGFVFVFWFCCFYFETGSHYDQSGSLAPTCSPPECKDSRLVLPLPDSVLFLLLTMSL